MRIIELMIWVEAFASCAIEGNKAAKRMIELWDNGETSEFSRQVERDWIPRLDESKECKQEETGV